MDETDPQTPLPGASMLSNSNATIEEGEVFNANRDVHKTVKNLGDADVIQDTVSPFMEVNRSQSTNDGKTGTGNWPSEDGSQPEVKLMDIVPADPSSLPVTSTADKYTRSLLECLVGYPLYDPRPLSELSEEYMREGVRVGDVGFVREDGAFDFLFNVCPSQNSLINPPGLPDSFTLEAPGNLGTRSLRPLPRNTHFFAPTVTRTNDIYMNFVSNGAILELPEGAFREEALSMIALKALAVRCGVQWYMYAIGTRDRDIPNGSLCLVTSCTKCTQWGIAVFDRPCSAQDGLRFVSNKGQFLNLGSKYRWKGSGATVTKVTPHPGPDSPNQCVFLRGFRVVLRQNIFDHLRNDLLYRPPQVSTSSPSPKRHRDQYRRQNSDHPPTEAKNEDNHGIPIQTSITPEYPSIDHGEPVPSTEAGHGLNPDFSGAPAITTELHSVDRRDKVVQRGDAPSTSLFPGSSNPVITSSNFYAVSGNAAIIRSDDGQITDVQRSLFSDYIANPTVLPDINGDVKKHVLTQSIKTLPRAEAVFNNYQIKNSGPCLGGTRVALLREMANWATSSEMSRMYVLSGLVGIGKSTVAYTIASRAADLDLLGASFFFSRDDADRNNAKKFFTTIAYQLCVYNETFAKAIEDVLGTEHGSAATTAGPQEQMQFLILEPLRSIVKSRVRPILVVVDALDECDEDDGRAVVEGLSHLIRELPSFKVILTTRPQPSLDPFFDSQLEGGYNIFHLQDIDDKVVDSDIRHYLKHNLSLLQVQKHYPLQQWCASDEEIESLVRASRRLFIIASRAVRYILDESASDPAYQMRKLLHAFAQGRIPFEDLNEIQQDFDMNFGRVVFGWGTILAILTAILVHRR